MNKHGNTLFPEDRVTKYPDGNDKTASAKHGVVKDIDSSGADIMVKVAWDDGTETFEDPSKLNK